ncbi:MAG: dihydroorotate dehydrogenase electron transfer subunit [Ignavibacteriaceae bacterium]
MFIVDAPVVHIQELDNNIYLQKIYCPQISHIIKPGQFLNVKVSDGNFPLLRRPFSVCDVQGDHLFLMFNIFGEGTRLLANRQPGSKINLLGPLGNGFSTEGDFDTAVIVAGGLGAAPFPYLTKMFGHKKNIITFIGGRSKHEIITYGMQNVQIATDDGSKGFKGTVVSLFESKFSSFENTSIRVFGCGPTPMLKALSSFCKSRNIQCEISTECAMACGFGICMGCPVQSAVNQNQYLLVCKDGPVFNINDIIL